MSKTVLITGASSGLGEELAKLFASEGYNLVLVARSEQKMQALAESIEQEHGVTAWVCAKDLTKPGAADEVYDFTRSRGIGIEILVNNAGFGDFGKFHELSRAKQTNMIDLNVRALVDLTHVYLADMVAEGGGKILNVASIAAFQPGPLMAVYYATKAFVLSFSEALSVELKGTGVSVTALCPGPTKTGFESAADLETSGLFRNLPVATAKQVVDCGYKALMRGKTVAVQGFVNKAIVFSTRFAPRALVREIVYKIQK